MLIYDRKGRQRQLQTIWIAREPRLISPTEIAEEIILTHPALPFGAELDGTNSFTFSGAVGVTQVLGDEPEVDTFWWVHAASLNHNDATPRPSFLELLHVASGNIVPIANSLSLAANDRVISPRSILVPRGWRLTARVQALGAGNILTLAYMALRNEAGEMPPYL